MLILSAAKPAPGESNEVKIRLSIYWHRTFACFYEKLTEQDMKKAMA